MKNYLEWMTNQSRNTWYDNHLGAFVTTQFSSENTSAEEYNHMISLGLVSLFDLKIVNPPYELDNFLLFLKYLIK